MLLNFVGDIIRGALGTKYSVVYNDVETGKSAVVLEFDSIAELSYESTSSISSHPIEAGYRVMDYKYVDADTIRMVGEISLHRPLEQIIDPLGNNAKRKIDTELKRYKSGIYDLSIYTRTGVREHMTLVGYTIAETYDNYGKIVVDMDFQEILTPVTASYLKDKTLGEAIDAGVAKVTDAVEAGIGKVKGFFS